MSISSVNSLNYVSYQKPIVNNAKSSSVQASSQVQEQAASSQVQEGVNVDGAAALKDKIESIFAVQEETFAYQKELQFCATREDVASLRMAKITEVMDNIKEAKNNKSISEEDRLLYIMGEHQKMMSYETVAHDFIMSSNYSNLPSSFDVIQGAIGNKNSGFNQIDILKSFQPSYYAEQYIELQQQYGSNASSEEVDVEALKQNLDYNAKKLFATMAYQSVSSGNFNPAMFTIFA